jgi:hypothetical protein
MSSEKLGSKSFSIQLAQLLERYDTIFMDFKETESNA